MNKKAFSSAGILTGAAMMTALSVLIGIICKNFLTFSVYYRITFENLPIILSGILYGPAVGAVTGLAADTVSCLCSANPAVNPLISVGAMTVGASAGIAARYIIKKHGRAQYALCVASAHLLGQVIIKSAAKILWLGMPWYGVFIGLAVSLFAGTLEYLAIGLIMRTVVLKRRGVSNDV